MLKPFKHQAVSLKHDATTDEVYDCSEPGTGKTGVRIWAYAARRRTRKAGCLLVLASKSLLRSVWANDFRKFAPDMKVVVSMAGKHDETFAQDADVYVMNHDAVKWLSKKNKKFFARFTDLVVDESTAYKHHTSQRSKAAAKIAPWFERRACMTGTPNGRSITDVWHQVYIVDLGKRLGKSFFAFRAATCEPVQVGKNVNAIAWQDKEGAEEAVFGALSDIVVRHKLEDMPPNHQYDVPYDLTGIQRKTYQEMQDKMVAELYGDPLALEKMRLGKKLVVKDHLTAINAAAVATKLLQISSGAVYNGDGEKYHVIDTQRYELILDLVEQRNHSIVFFLWKHQRDLLLAEAEKRGVTFAMIDGGVNERERERIVTAYQRGDYQVLFAHPKSAAHGLTLTRGTATIWASPTYDLEIFKQGSRRVYRIGQKNETENIVVLAEDTIERKVYDHMLAKDARMTKLLDLFGTLTPSVEAPTTIRKRKAVAA